MRNRSRCPCRSGAFAPIAYPLAEGLAGSQTPASVRICSLRPGSRLKLPGPQSGQRPRHHGRVPATFRACICIYIYIYVCVCVCVCVCMCIYVYIYIYTYIHTYIHTHTPKPSQLGGPAVRTPRAAGSTRAPQQGRLIRIRGARSRFRSEGLRFQRNR